MVAATSRFASPRPFVRALMRPGLLLELAVPVFVAFVLTAVASSEALATLLFGASDAPPMDERQRRAAAIQIVSIVAASLSAFWYWHLTRMLRGFAAFSYPQLASRVRGALLAFATLCGMVTLLAVWRSHSLADALSLAALGASWAAWPLWLHLRVPFAVRAGMLATAPFVMVWPTSAYFVAGPVWPWVGPVALLGGMTIMLAIPSTTTVRQLVQFARPAPQRSAASTDRRTSDLDVPSPVYTTTNDWARALTQLMLPRLSLPSWMPRPLRVVLNRATWWVGGLVWYLLGADASLLGLSASIFVPIARHDLWWPLGRHEQLRVAMRVTYGGMLRVVLWTFGTVLALGLLHVPRLPFGMNGTPLHENMVALAMLIAVLPFIHIPWGVPSIVVSPGRQLRRVFPALLLIQTVTLVSAHGQRTCEALVISAVVLVLALFELRWRLRRHFLYGDLHRASAS